MTPHFKIVIVAENASELLAKSRELAGELAAGAPVIEEVQTTVNATPKRQVGQQSPSQEITSGHAASPSPGMMTSAPAATGGDEKDAVGMPWDERIHMENKKKKADGTWQNLRGIDKAFKAQVEAELRGGTLPTGQAQPNPAQAFGGFPTGPVAPPSPAAPAPTPVAPPMGIAHGHNIETFTKNLPLILMELGNAGKLSDAYTLQLKQWLQVAELVDVVKDPAKIQNLFNLFVQYKFIQAA